MPCDAMRSSSCYPWRARFCSNDTFFRVRSVGLARNAASLCEYEWTAPHIIIIIIVVAAIVRLRNGAGTFYAEWNYNESVVVSSGVRMTSSSVICSIFFLFIRITHHLWKAVKGNCKNEKHLQREISVRMKWNKKRLEVSMTSGRC